jgi:hypothetical protein
VITENDAFQVSILEIFIRAQTEQISFILSHQQKKLLISVNTVGENFHFIAVMFLTLWFIQESEISNARYVETTLLIKVL